MVEISINNLYNSWCDIFKKSCISNFKNEVLWIIQNYIDVSIGDIHFLNSYSISRANYENILNALEKRAERYPLQYILGTQPFYTRDYFVGEGVLVPRNDTECICTKAIESINIHKYNSFVDICSGTGCIGITLEKETHITRCVAIENSLLAYRYLEKNKNFYSSNMDLKLLDIFDKKILEDLPDKFDLVVSNPPYLTEKDMENLQPEVIHEPREALFGEINGLAFYHRIVSISKIILNKGGMILFEIGLGQNEDVRKILQDNCFFNIAYIYDENNIIRGIYGFK
ncbi:MAG: peptide chain release factor N(5)-glutamine methyltransferase [Oscillospiraceae bacterium]|nr:peptide chain release factor N(5)-glutamine methyltransferase [Oscillospiraceae bacterium]